MRKKLVGAPYIVFSISAEGSDFIPFEEGGASDSAGGDTGSGGNGGGNPG